MAETTEKYGLRTPSQNDFFDVKDISENMEKLENALTEFDDSGTVEDIKSFPDFLTKLVTGNKLAVTIRNLKAGLQFVLHAGQIVNNCVTDNAGLPLSAAQGKALMDKYTQLYSDMSNQLKNMHQTVRHPTNITTGTNILKLGPGFYVYEDKNSSDQDKLNMGFPAPIWHSHIHVLGSLNNSNDIGYISIIIEDMNDANGSKIYYRLHAWTEWRPWRMISTTEVSTSST